MSTTLLKGRWVVRPDVLKFNIRVSFECLDIT
jgi:hypothetical protein